MGWTSLSLGAREYAAQIGDGGEGFEGRKEKFVVEQVIGIRAVNSRNRRHHRRQVARGVVAPVRFQRLRLDARGDLRVGSQARVSLPGHVQQLVEFVGLCLGSASRKQAGARAQTSGNCRTRETMCLHGGDRVKGRRV